MRILFLSPQPFFRVRGTPINIRNMVTALAEAGHEVDLLTYPIGEAVDLPDGVRHLRSPRVPGIREIKVGFSAAKLPLDALMALHTGWRLLWGRYDVIHAVEESAFWAAWYNRWLFRRPKLVMDMDSCISEQLVYGGTTKPGGFIARLARWMERRAIQRSTFVLTVCRALSNTVLELDPDAQVVQIEDAPLEETFTPQAEQAERLAREFELGPEPRIVYTGNFESYQGVELLVDALGHLPDLPATLVLVGGKPDHINALRQRASEAGVDGRVVFTGPRPLEEMPAFLTLGDVLGSPRVEGTNTALKVYGYMQSGTPIVATNLETHTQVLDDSTAYLVAPTSEGVAGGIRAALADPEHAGSIGAAAKQRVDERYSLRVFKQRVVEAYTGLQSG